MCALTEVTVLSRRQHRTRAIPEMRLLSDRVPAKAVADQDAYQGEQAAAGGAESQGAEVA